MAIIFTLPKHVLTPPDPPVQPPPGYSIAGMMGSITATWAIVTAIPLFASALITQPVAAQPLPNIPAQVSIIQQNWPSPDWPAQRAPFTPQAPAVVVAQQQPFTSSQLQIVEQWPQPDWPTQTTSKLSFTGPEVYPVSKTDWRQLQIVQTSWIPPDPPSQTT